MIIVKLMGGLGNQMFQYAAGRRLAHIHKTSLELDLGWFKSIAAVDAARKYELTALNIKERIISSDEIDKLTGTSATGFFRRLIKKCSPHGLIIYREKHPQFDPHVLNLKDMAYLEGYWQSEKYFIDIDEIIRDEFTVKTEPDNNNARLAGEIQNSDSVSIHIRRGDYVSNKVTNQYHGTCHLDYYHAAVDIITKKIKEPHFFAFSDDPSWVKDNLGLEYPVTYVDFNNNEEAYQDLRLMSLCRHHIIANSSFSWWGAWLSRNSDKIIIAPSKWFNDSSINTKDLIPDGWIRI